MSGMRTTIPLLKLSDLASLLAGTIQGDSQLEISAFAAEPLAAEVGDFCFVFSERYLQALLAGELRASACIVPTSALSTKKFAGLSTLSEPSLLLVANPKLAIKQLLDRFAPPRPFGPAGQHPSAVIDPSAVLAPDVSVGPHAYIGPGAQLAEGVVIGPGTVVGAGVRIGARTQLAARVTVEANCVLGADCIIHPGAVIGADGFSYVYQSPTLAEQLQASPLSYQQLRNEFRGTTTNPPHKVRSAGRVVIGDEVEIGANTTIDRGTLGDTVIGDRCKLDNHVQLAHNCRLGEECVIAGQTGLAGSVILGDRTTIGGQAGVKDNTKLGADTLLVAASHASRDTEPATILAGDPAVEPGEYIERQKALRRAAKDLLPLKRQVAELTKRLAELSGSE